jgi:hypothetical protein
VVAAAEGSPTRARVKTKVQKMKARKMKAWKTGE